MTSTIRVFATVAVAALVGAMLGIGGWELLDDDTSTPAVIGTPSTDTNDTSSQQTPISGGAPSVADVYRQVKDAVVEVRAETPQGTATGSGFVIDAEGRVVTNQHVVGEAETATVVTAEGDRYDADVVGTDPSTDIALLDVEDGADLPSLQLGATSSLSVGDPVIAIGSPFGLQNSVTTGIVSGLDRQIQAPDGRFVIDGAIQTDAALNSGNSGGPLLDARGRVVGVNAQIESRTGGNVGVGYAIPIDIAKTVVQQLLEDGTASHGYLGVQLGDPSGEDGVPVVEVVDGGPADTAGLQAGDRILRVAGEQVETVGDVRVGVAERQPGASVRLQVERDGDTKTITVVLGDRAAATG